MKTFVFLIIRIISATERIWLYLTVLELYAKDYCLTHTLYVLFLVMAAMLLDGSIIPTTVLCRIHQGTFIPSLVPIDQIMSKKKIFERNNVKNSKNVEKGQ